jgi:hypothetical protein
LFWEGFEASGDTSEEGVRAWVYRRVVFGSFGVRRWMNAWAEHFMKHHPTPTTPDNQRNAAMIKAVQEVGDIISKAKPITESADAVTSYTEEFLKDVS